MTIDEFFATRERLYEEVLAAEPGEDRLRAFAKFEHRDNSPDMEHEVSLELCYLLTQNRMANEIIEMRADHEAMEKRYAEIEKYYGPRMLFAVAKTVGWCSPPRCCVCRSEEDRGPDDPFKTYSSDSWGPDWMHHSCEQKFTSWAEDEQKQPEREHGIRLIPEMAVLDAAWREKHSV